MAVAGVLVVSRSHAAEPPTVPVASAAAPSERTFKPGVMLQGWFTASDAGDGSNSFRVRRAEVSGKGEIVRGQVAYSMMFDLARLLEFQDKSLPVAGGAPGSVTAKQPAGGSSVLQDVFITYLTSVADFSIGQFKTPVSYEGSGSSSKLLFPERALVASAYGDKRDPGLRATKQFQYVGYAAALHNGAGVNALDNNQGKDGVLRLELYPLPGLLVGGVASGTLWRRRDVGAKDRYEADLRFAQGPVLFQGEYIYGRDHVQRPGGKRWQEGQGFYAAAAVHLGEPVQIGGRFGWLDPDSDKPDDDTQAIEGTLNWYFRKFEARAQLAFSHFRRSGGASSDNVVIFAAQTQY